MDSKTSWEGIPWLHQTARGVHDRNNVKNPHLTFIGNSRLWYKSDLGNRPVPEFQFGLVISYLSTTWNCSEDQMRMCLRKVFKKQGTEIGTGPLMSFLWATLRWGNFLYQVQVGNFSVICSLRELSRTLRDLVMCVCVRAHAPVCSTRCTTLPLSKHY